jgi:hypothetical protein
LVNAARLLDGFWAAVDGEVSVTHERPLAARGQRLLADARHFGRVRWQKRRPQMIHSCSVGPHTCADFRVLRVVCGALKKDAHRVGCFRVGTGGREARLCGGDKVKKRDDALFVARALCIPGS